MEYTLTNDLKQFSLILDRSICQCFPALLIKNNKVPDLNLARLCFKVMFLCTSGLVPAVLSQYFSITHWKSLSHRLNKQLLLTVQKCKHQLFQTEPQIIILGLRMMKSWVTGYNPKTKQQFTVEGSTVSVPEGSVSGQDYAFFFL